MNIDFSFAESLSRLSYGNGSCSPTNDGQCCLYSESTAGNFNVPHGQAFLTAQDPYSKQIPLRTNRYVVATSHQAFKRAEDSPGASVESAKTRAIKEVQLVAKCSNVQFLIRRLSREGGNIGLSKTVIFSTSETCSDPFAVVCVGADLSYYEILGSPDKSTSAELVKSLLAKINGFNPTGTFRGDEAKNGEMVALGTSATRDTLCKVSSVDDGHISLRCPPAANSRLISGAPIFGVTNPKGTGSITLDVDRRGNPIVYGLVSQPDPRNKGPNRVVIVETPFNVSSQGNLALNTQSR